MKNYFAKVVMALVILCGSSFGTEVMRTVQQFDGVDSNKSIAKDRAMAGVEKFFSTEGKALKYYCLEELEGVYQHTYLCETISGSRFVRYRVRCKAEISCTYDPSNLGR